MIGHLGKLIGDYGYYVVALFILLEGMCLPFPTDTTLVTAAAFAAHGRLSLLAIFVISTTAATIGTTVAFYGGRRGGQFFERHSKKVNPKVLLRTRAFMDRHGGLAVAIGRFIPVARMLISPLAGLSSMSLARFTAYNVVGAAVWSAVFCGIGYFFGHHPPAFGHGLVRGAFVVVLGLALIIIVLVAGGWLVEESDAAWRAEGTMWHRVLMSAPARWLASRSPAMRSFLFRRFTPGDYLGLNLTIGLGLSFVAIVIFSAVAKALLEQDAVPQFDLDLATALRESASPASLAFWSAISSAGRLPLVAIPGLLLAAMLSRRTRSWLPAIGYAASWAGSTLLDLAVKHFYAHPHVAAGGVTMGTPSGQALGSLVGYGMIAYFLILLVSSYRLRVAIASLMVMVVVAVSFGRLYTGSRYFSDVVVGMAAGGVWLAACLTGLEVARRRGELGIRVDPTPEKVEKILE